MVRWIKGWMAVAATGLLVACGGGGGSPTVADRALNDERFTILAEALRTTGLDGALRGSGPLTLFAPTNAAFASLLSELGLTQQQLLSDRALLDTVLRYHVLGAEVQSGAVQSGQPVTTLQGGIVKIETTGGGLVVTDGRNRTSRVTQADWVSRNGVLHAVDRVLLPANRNIVQTAQAAAPEFGILLQAATAAGLVDALSAPGPLTVFAPTDAAFASLLGELGLTAEQLLGNTELLTRVLSYHVVPSRVLAAQIPATPITSLQGGSFSISGGVITDARGRTANLAATDIFATNGVIHVIDRVILPLPAENIVAVAQAAAPEFSILVQAVVAANLVDTLSGPGPFTVFAPTDAAFAALLSELNLTAAELLADTDLLTRVLTYHVVPGRVLAAQVPTGTPITTVQGGSFTVSPGLVITDSRARTANIVATNVFASNGVIHVIDRVILPLPAENIVAVAQAAAPEFSILVQAVAAAGLVDVLSGAGPFTVFAPTNAAFSALLTELGVTAEALLADAALLTQVLTYHVVPGRVLAAQVPTDTPIATVQGSSFTISPELVITDSRMRTANIVATDGVILPPAS
jgi:uncharacterized surface protein with fasciclin (FAS1) repeats